MTDLATLDAMTDEQLAQLEAAAEHDLNRIRWTAGDLRDLLDETQRRIYDSAKAAWEKNAGAASVTALDLESLTIEALNALPKRIAGAKCSRRLGKSAVALVIATEKCIRKPGCVVKYLAKDAVDVGIIVEKIMEDVILKTCPTSIRPVYKEHKGVYEFPNGSVIEFYGVNDGKVEDLRGHAADFVVCDEIGSWQDPKYAIESIVVPLIMTTGGCIYIASTPAKTAGHSSKKILDDLAADGLLSRFTICDSKRIPPLVKVQFLVLAGETKEHALEVIKSNGRILPKTTTARREYFVMDVTDAGSAILPEFQDVEENVVVRVVEVIPETPTEGYRYVTRPRFFFGITTIDPAPVNIIAILHGYLDFDRDVIVIQREKFARGSETSSDGVADAIKGGEQQIWGENVFAGGRKQPARRIIDPDSKLEADLQRDHKLSFTHAEKKDRDAGIRVIRAMLLRDPVALEIDESCVELRRQMRENVLNSRGTDYAMGPDGDHSDGISALHYFVRAVRHHESPYPENWQALPQPPGVWFGGGQVHAEPTEQLRLNDGSDFMQRLTDDGDERPSWHLTGMER